MAKKIRLPGKKPYLLNVMTNRKYYPIWYVWDTYDFTGNKGIYNFCFTGLQYKNTMHKIRYNYDILYHTSMRKFFKIDDISYQDTLNAFESNLLIKCIELNNLEVCEYINHGNK